MTGVAIESRDVEIWRADDGSLYAVDSWSGHVGGACFGR